MEQWHYWYLLSVLLFVLEAAAIPGIGLFFAALAALTLGLFVQVGLFPHPDWLVQTTAFFFLTGLWAIALWKPLQKMRIRRAAKGEKHHDVIGRSAEVGPGGIAKGKKGNAYWSGALLTARLADDAAIASAAPGEELKVVAVEGSTLILAESTYTIRETAASPQ
ncbi:MAG: hypothetical protein FJX23_10270 [Alphaproteobacteria bacterium]|nr:hypothetical protein [Alphaproteobacteria bacterium]